MKVEITEKGVHDQTGAEIAKGTQITLEGDVLPGWLVGKAQVVAASAKAKTAVTNPKKGAIKDPAPSAAERQAIMKEAAAHLTEEEFIEGGFPEVNALNKHLPEGTESFTADERDQLWPGIAEA